MFVPNIKTFRQASLLIFLLAGSVNAETTLYDELKFLEDSANEVEVFLPGEETKKQEVVWEQDSISTGQAGLQKKSVISSTYPSKSKYKKRLRFRSR